MSVRQFTSSGRNWAIGGARAPPFFYVTVYARMARMAGRLRSVVTSAIYIVMIRQSHRAIFSSQCI